MNHNQMRSRVIGYLVAVLLLVGCGAPTPTPTALPTPTPTPAPTSLTQTASEIQKAARDALNAAGTYYFDINGLVTVDVPSEGVQLDIPILFAGEVQTPDRMQSSLTMTVMGNTVETEVIAIAGEFWAKDPTTGQWVTSTGSEVPVSPQQFTNLSEAELAGMALLG